MIEINRIKITSPKWWVWVVFIITIFILYLLKDKIQNTSEIEMIIRWKTTYYPPIARGVKGFIY